MVESRTFKSIQPQRHRLERFRTDRTEPTENIQTGVFIKWTNKQTKIARCNLSITVHTLVIAQICECIDEDLQSITQISTWTNKKQVWSCVVAKNKCGLV